MDSRPVPAQDLYRIRCSRSSYCTRCTHAVHTLYTRCAHAHAVHMQCTRYAHAVHMQCIRCTATAGNTLDFLYEPMESQLVLYRTCTRCTHAVHMLCTRCTHAHAAQVLRNALTRYALRSRRTCTACALHLLLRPSASVADAVHTLYTCSLKRYYSSWGTALIPRR